MYHRGWVAATTAKFQQDIGKEASIWMISKNLENIGREEI